MYSPPFRYVIHSLQQQYVHSAARIKSMLELSKSLFCFPLSIILLQFILKRVINLLYMGWFGSGGSLET